MVQKQTTLEWDDLRFALLLARDGSVRGAARTLAVSHTTVLRRIASLEEAVGVRLFERRRDGYALTVAGQDVYDTARSLEDVIGALERRVEGRDVRPTGEVTMTCPDPLLSLVLPMVRELGAAYPDIRITIDAGATYRALERREADLALRIADEPTGDLVGLRLGFVGTAIYGAKSYLEGRKTDDLEALDWVTFEAGSRALFERWRESHAPASRVALRASTPWAIRDGVTAGLGVAIYPRVSGDDEPTWRRIRLLPRGAGAPLWLLTHRDLRTTARVRVVRDFIAKRFARWKNRLAEPA
jgi:DNA-binding transcriptional LysR family regulator